MTNVCIYVYLNEVRFQPLVILDSVRDLLNLAADRDRGMTDIRELSGRMIAPDDHVAYGLRRNADT